VIEAEKEQQQLIAGIENFDSTKLKHTVTEEKNPLPTKEGKFEKIILVLNKLISTVYIFDVFQILSDYRYFLLGHRTF